MELSDLNKEYDKLQRKYGAKELNSIYNGGSISPDICFIFMNPTGTNPASKKEWTGLRAPWIGTKNIWKLFYRIGLLEENIFNEIQQCRPKDWDETFASRVYNNVTLNNYYITNFGKCTQVDARALPDSVYEKYLELLYKEITLIKPKIIVTFGNQVSSIFLGTKINVSQCRKKVFKKIIENQEYCVYPTFYPVGNGMRNIELAIEDLKWIIKNTYKK